jgi:hypothetical protein
VIGEVLASMALTLFLLVLVAGVSGHDSSPGATSSFGEGALKRGVGALVPTIVNDIKQIVIPGINQSLFQIEPIRFDDVSVGSYDVSVVPGKGLQLSLKDMSNTIAHAKLVVDVKLFKCTGEIWAFAKGASFTAMNTIVVDEDGNGKLQVTPGDFEVGYVEIHHKMDGFICEGAADVFHVINAVVIALLKKELAAHFGGIVSKIVSKPVNLFLQELQFPPALGFGKEKFQLDNSYLSVNYENGRLTHLHKGEWKSTVHPQTSPLQPGKLPQSAGRDVELAFSDYMFNTLFDALHAENIGQEQLQIPFIHTIFDKECPKCPIILRFAFSTAARQTFKEGKAVAHVQDLTLEICALNNASKVLPMVTLSVNVSAGVAFALSKTPTNYAIKSTLSLENFTQKLVLSHIGKIDISDLSRDLRSILTSVIGKINTALPALSIPTLGGATLGKPAFIIDEGAVVLQADMVLPDQAGSVILI